MKVIMRSSDDERGDSTLDTTIVGVGYGADNCTVGRQQPYSQQTHTEVFGGKDPCLHVTHPDMVQKINLCMYV